jgi:hypothetical protein
MNGYERRPAREDAEPPHGRRMVVGCERCTNTVLLNPQSVFGSKAAWPAEGRSYRFRCQCGSREAKVRYTTNQSQKEGPISRDALRLWF